MNSLIIHSCDNSHGKKDATGAFIPEAKNLEKYLERTFPDGVVYRNEVYTDGRNVENRSAQVEGIFEFYDDTVFDLVFFLCHGYPTGMQFGFNGTKGADDLGEIILKHNPAVEMVTFYSCSVCKGKDNFAKWLYDYINPRSTAWDFQVFGHFTKGHTTKNPRIKIYSRDYLPFIWTKDLQPGTNELVAPKNSKEYFNLIQDESSDFRFAIPFAPRVFKKFGLTDNLRREV